MAGHAAPGAPDVLLGPLVGEVVDADARQGRLEVTVVGEGPCWWLDGTGRVLRHVVGVVSNVAADILNDGSRRLSALARKSGDGRGAVQGVAIRLSYGNCYLPAYLVSRTISVIS